MSEERLIDYDALLHEAFRDAQRAVMRTILLRVAEDGLPGDHHFYISFNTQAPGVSIAPRLLQKYPAEMTVVLQHRFWDLIVHADRFEVKLTFDGIRERLVVPFSAVRVFFDPSVPYGLQFEEAQDTRRSGNANTSDADQPARSPRSGTRAAGDRRRVTKKPKADQIEQAVRGDHAEPPTPIVAKPLEKPHPAAAAMTADADPQSQSAHPQRSGPRLVERAPDGTGGEGGESGEGAKVVRLDQFRRK